MKAVLARAALFLGVACLASGATLTFSHTWDGTEPSGTERLFRDAVPSLPDSPKAYPGAFGNVPTYFQTWTIAVTPGTVITVTPTEEDINSFLAIYDGSFAPSNLATNYLGDQGSSLVTSVFGVYAPASGQVVLVAMSLSGSSALGHTVAGEVEYSGSEVPEPTTVAMLGLGLGALVAGRRLVRR